VEAIEEAAADAAFSAGVKLEEIARFSCGIAGIESTGVTDRLVATLEAAWGKGRVLVSSDARIALAGSSDGPVDQPAVVLIAGTGAIAFGRGKHGGEARAGGWGPVIGDEGSGFAIARRGLSAVVRDLDGRGPHTQIRDLLFDSEGTRSPAELLQKIYRSEGGPADVAAYFPLVLRAAREGDAIARTILREAGEELALAAATVIQRLDLKGESFPVSMVGGVFAAGDILISPLRERLRAVAPGARLGPPAYPPEIGAIRLALAAEVRAA
jgi:N-acetylglucosamine kinase-like BadF-type ATPase